jgi:23S rRNA G2445 N2-methylase RlmL
MVHRQRKVTLHLLAATLAAAMSAVLPAAAFGEQAPALEQTPTPSRTPDVVFIPTPQPVVDRMMDLAGVGPNDVVYDLGCGDGRMVIAAIRHGARRAVGVDIDPKRIAEARANARAAGVEDRVRFIQGDLFQTDLSEATVVAIYLLPDLNMRLRPKLLELRPGTRIVSHAFDMGDWKPQREEEVDGKKIYLWTVPARPPRQARGGGH